MEDKSGAPNNLEWGEIIAEVSIMMETMSRLFSLVCEGLEELDVRLWT
jgi:hypothetical protein